MTEEQYSPEEIQAAEAAENQAFIQAQMQYLQGRVVALGVEISRRDKRIVELETENSELKIGPTNVSA